MSQIPFAIIGGGWRAEFFLRIAQAAPQMFNIVGMSVRKAERRDALQKQFGVKCFETPEQLLAQTKPQFVVISVPRSVAPAMIKQMAAANMPVLCETPPADGLDALIDLWKQCGKSTQIQVAEQYPFQPHHAARLALLDAGRIGTPSYIQVSVAHGYHAMVLARKALRIGFENPTVTGRQFTAPLVQGPNRAGAPTKEAVKSATQDLVFYDFGDKLAIYDFCGDQYMSYIRARRILVRGDRGELNGDHALTLKDFATPISLELQRQQTGADGDLDGFYLKGITAGQQWVYTNPLPVARLSDDEIAVGTCLLNMSEYVQTGKSFYSLAEACQDAYLELLAGQAIKSGPVKAQTQPWAG